MTNLELTDKELCALKVVLEKARFQFTFDSLHADTHKYAKECNNHAQSCQYFLNKIKQALTST